MLPPFSFRMNTADYTSYIVPSAIGAPQYTRSPSHSEFTNCMECTKIACAVINFICMSVAVWGHFAALPDVIVIPSMQPLCYLNAFYFEGVVTLLRYKS